MPPGPLVYGSCAYVYSRAINHLQTFSSEVGNFRRFLRSNSDVAVGVCSGLEPSNIKLEWSPLLRPAPSSFFFSPLFSSSTERRETSTFLRRLLGLFEPLISSSHNLFRYTASAFPRAREALPPRVPCTHHRIHPSVLPDQRTDMRYNDEDTR